jgi:hypothetical protein
MIVLTEDLNTISEGIPFGYIDLNSKPTEPCSCSCLMKESLGYVKCILSKLKRALVRLK